MTDLSERVRPDAPKTPPTSSGRTAGLFRAFWRWHFYGSALVIPILLVLASSGLVYLLRFQIDPLFAGAMKNDLASNAAYRPLSEQQSAVEAAYDGAVIMSVSEPRELGDNTRFVIATAEEAAKGLAPWEMATQDVYVNPSTGEVAGLVDPNTTVSGYALRLHSELMAGPRAERLIELGACWAIVMAVTGYYLYFRGRKARVRRVASEAAGAKLRSRHGVVGLFVGVALLTLLVSGLPWTGFWGAKAQELATDRGTSLWSMDPGAESQGAQSQGSQSQVDGLTMEENTAGGHHHETAWAAGETEVPESEVAPGRAPIGIDRAALTGVEQGLQRPLTITYPGGETGVYSIAGDAFHDPSREKTVHLDQYTGEVAAAYGFADYPLLAKAVAQGIGLHEGRSLGLVSFWGAIAACLAVIFMCVSGPVMWWRRRPRGAGSVGAPRGRLPLKSSPVLLVAVVLLGVLLPFFGVSLLLVLALDQLVLRRVPALRRAFDVT